MIFEGRGPVAKQNSRGVYAFPVEAVQGTVPSAIVGDVCISMDGEYLHPDLTEKLLCFCKPSGFLS